MFHNGSLVQKPRFEKGAGAFDELELPQGVDPHGGEFPRRSSAPLAMPVLGAGSNRLPAGASTDIIVPEADAPEASHLERTSART